MCTQHQVEPIKCKTSWCAATMLYRRGLCLRCYQEWRVLINRSGGELGWQDLVALGLVPPRGKPKGQDGYCYLGHKIIGARCRECQRRLAREWARRKRERIKAVIAKEIHP